MSVTICYCFNYTDEDIIADVETHGRSLILKRIMTGKKAGECECAVKNLSGR